MGTGIVSVGMASDNRHTISVVLLALAAAVWVALGIVLGWRVARDPGRVRREARTPAALTAVAATAVLGARTTGLGSSGLAAALLVLATGIWLVLIWPVVRGLGRGSAGVAFMVVVSTESLSVLASQLALRARAGWLLYVALVLFVLGVVAYVFVLAAFDFRQLLEGHGDQWVSGGSLTISTMAAARLVIGIGGVHQLAAASGLLKVATLVLWAVSIAWLPPLIGGEAIRPRLSYDVRRWATVFPVGMYAACSFDAGRALRSAAVLDFGRVWVWLGVGLWCVVFAAMLRRPLSSKPRRRGTSRAARSS